MQKIRFFKYNVYDKLSLKIFAKEHTGGTDPKSLLAAESL